MSSGFTLVELLIVVAIIGVLSSVVISSLNGARMKSRDARRVSDLKQIRIALEMYYDQNGSYPIVKWATSGITSYDSSLSRWTQLQNFLSPYISKLPADPKSSGSSGPWYTGNYHYAYGSVNGLSYDLVGQFEDIDNSQRCSIRQYRYHSGEGAYPPETIWCGNFSPYMYADH